MMVKGYHQPYPFPWELAIFIETMRARFGVLEAKKETGTASAWDVGLRNHLSRFN